MRSTRRARYGRVVGMLGGAVLMGGCASQTSGGGAFDLLSKGQGDYVLSAAEIHWNCGGIENALQARITRIMTLSHQAKAESDTTPPTISRFFSRLAGEPDSPALAQLKTERAAAEAYNRELKTKGCPAVDIDARLAAAGAIMPVVAAASLPAPDPSIQGQKGKL